MTDCEDVRTTLEQLIEELEALHATLLGHAVHVLGAGAIEGNRIPLANAWESAAAQVWQVLCKHDPRRVLAEEKTDEP